MTEKAGGAPTRDGLIYQDYAAAYYFITDGPDFLPNEVEELHIERHDSDFAFILRNGGKEQHYFEVKKIGTGELKWGGKFKRSVFPEFYRINSKHAEYGPSDVAYYHLVTNGAAAESVNNFIDGAESLRKGTRWETFKTKYGRDELSKLVSGIESDSVVANEDDVDPEPTKDDLYHTVWGLQLHTPTFEELSTKLENYFRRCSPARFREPMTLVINEISETDSGVIKRRELENLAGISLTPQGRGTSPAAGKTQEELRSEVESIGSSRSDTSPEVTKLRKEKEILREFSDRLEQRPSTDSFTINTAAEVVDDLYEKLEDAAKEKSSTESEISQQIDTLIEQADLSSTNSDDYE